MMSATLRAAVGENVETRVIDSTTDSTGARVAIDFYVPGRSASTLTFIADLDAACDAVSALLVSLAAMRVKRLGEPAVCFPAAS